jgi:hypothetical protein
MPLPGRFRCYSCGFEHPISQREYVNLGGERLPRGLGCLENPGKLQEIADEREFYKALHAMPNPRYAHA